MPSPPSLRPERIRAVVFDLDGTLVDSFAAITASVNAARRAASLPPSTETEVRRHVGRGLETLVEGLVGPEGMDESVRRFREHYAEVSIDMTSALPGARETLKELHRRGYRMAVASNKPERFCTPILEALGLLEYLDDVEGPDRAGRTKPDPAMIHRCLDAMAVDAAEAVYVGDMALDVRSAARAGLPVVLIPGGTTATADLIATGETVLGSLPQLLEILPRRPARLPEHRAPGIRGSGSEYAPRR